jgi:acyl-CoA synthetase (AMP-forming)/AMP-acid ligase II
MTSTNSTPTTLLGLIGSAPAERTAVIVPEQNIRVSYGSLRQQVQDVANQLAAAGIGPGDRVGMALTNGLPAIVSFLAASMAGTAAPLNPGYREDEFKFFLEDTNAKVLLLPPDGAAEARRAAGDGVPILAVQMDASGVVSLGNSVGNGKASPPDVNDVALILHTSGSTGRPKRVPLSHANLSISSGNVARSYALTQDDVSLCVMPLFHVHGLVASTLATLATGGTVVVPGKFSPLSFWRTAQEHGATWYSAVPTLHQLLLARAEAGSRPPGAERPVEYADILDPAVAQHPPGARRRHVAQVVVDDDGAVLADAPAARGRLHRALAGQRMPSGGGRSPVVGEFGLEVDVHGARDVPGEVVGPAVGLVETPAHVEEMHGIEGVAQLRGGDQERRRHAAQATGVDGGRREA